MTDKESASLVTQVLLLLLLLLLLPPPPPPPLLLLLVFSFIFSAINSFINRNRSSAPTRSTNAALPL
jgi:hypothetical protein